MLRSLKNAKHPLSFIADLTIYQVSRIPNVATSSVFSEEILKCNLSSELPSRSIHFLSRSAFSSNTALLTSPHSVHFDNSSCKCSTLLLDSLPKLTSENKELAENVIKGIQNALSRAITLCESSRWDHRGQAAALTQYLTSRKREMGNNMFRIGVTGPPGAGKSSLIETLGMRIVKAEKKIAVLAIDPSSKQTGGSILGDKTRMENLSCHPNAFVRPSPSGGQVGGLARSTSDSSVLCESAGFDYLAIETVGAGQADTEISDIVDFVMLVLPPSGGDELQGMKKGIMEVCDMVVVNKADGEMKHTAMHSVAQYQNALQYGNVYTQRKEWNVPVLRCSSHTGEGIEEIWTTLQQFSEIMTQNGEIKHKRDSQVRRVLLNDVKNEVAESLNNNAKVKGLIDEMEKQILSGFVSPRAAGYHVFKNLH